MEPSQIVRPLLDWYAVNARDLPWRRDVTPYRVWISEIMLQQTRVETVKGYFERFLAVVPDVAALAVLPEEQLLKLWEGLGYYARARNLQKAARACCERYGGALPGDYQALLSLSGFGPYTAGAVASIAFGLPVPAVDGNVLRVWSRLCADGADIADPATKKRVETEFAKIMPGRESGTFNQALMDLGATVCVPNGAPKCERCPLRTFCIAHLSAKETEFPQKRPKPPRRIEERTLLLLEREGRIAVRRRPTKGLLAALWELPGFDGRLTKDEAVAAVRSLGLEPLQMTPMAPYKHVFTHMEWHITGWRVKLASEGEGTSLVWLTGSELRGERPLPSAFQPYLSDFTAK